MRMPLLPLAVAAGVLMAGCAAGATGSGSTDAPATSVHLQATTVAYGAARSQFGELSVPAGTAAAAPVVVLIHGGFWSAAYGLDLMRPLVGDLVSRGYVVWNVEYRRVGEDGGGYPGTLDDVASAIDELAVLAKTHPLDLSRVALVGHSAGGHLALWAAGRPDQRVPAHVAVGLGPVVDLAGGARADLGGGAIVALLGGTPDDQPERYSAATPTTATSTKLIVVRGTEDSIVPAAFTLPVHDAGTIEVVDVAGEDHFDLIDPRSTSWAAVIRCLRVA